MQVGEQQCLVQAREQIHHFHVRAVVLGLAAKVFLDTLRPARMLSLDCV